MGKKKSLKLKKNKSGKNSSDQIAIKPETYTDPMFDEFKFCESCRPNVLTLIQHIRDQENAIIVAQQAIESMQKMFKKNEKVNFDLRVENGRLKKMLTGKEAGKLKGKMDLIDEQVERFRARDNLGVSE